MFDLDFNVTNAAPVKQTVFVINKIVRFKVQDILNYEVWTSICREGKTAVRNTTCTISKLLQLISAGYTIIPCKTSPKFCQQILLLGYDYSYEHKIKPTAFNKNIIPTFFINYEQPHYYGVSGTKKKAILGYCFNEPIRNRNLMETISNSLQRHIYHYDFYSNYELESYCSNDFNTNATSVTITNNIYIPVEGGIAHE